MQVTWQTRASGYRDTGAAVALALVLIDRVSIVLDQCPLFTQHQTAQTGSHREVTRQDGTIRVALSSALNFTQDGVNDTIEEVAVILVLFV